MNKRSTGNKPGLRRVTPHALEALRILEGNPGLTHTQLKQIMPKGFHLGTWWSYYYNVVKPIGGVDAWVRKRGLKS